VGASWASWGQPLNIKYCLADHKISGLESSHARADEQFANEGHSVAFKNAAKRSLNFLGSSKNMA